MSNLGTYQENEYYITQPEYERHIQEYENEMLAWGCTCQHKVGVCNNGTPYVAFTHEILCVNELCPRHGDSDEIAQHTAQTAAQKRPVQKRPVW